MDPSLAMFSGFLLEILKWTPTQQYRRASARKLEWKGTRVMRWGFPRKFSVGPELREVEGWMVGNLNGPQLGDVLRVSVGSFGMDPSLVMSEDIWWEIVRVMCSSHHM